MYLISVYFDNKTNQILQHYIERIAAQTDNDFMLANHVPPHLTISQIEARNPEVLVPHMEVLKGKLESGEIYFASVGMLLPYVIYAAPVLNAYLSELSCQVYEEFFAIPETIISKYYQPMSWLPHTTLGKTLSKVQMQTAVQVVQDSFAPFTATVCEIGLAKVNPHEDVVRIQLK